MPHYFYLARCADHSLYAGTCMDLKEREKKHNEGTGAKYTRSRKPVRMIYSESFKTLGEARRREAEVKKWRKSEKEDLVATNRPKNAPRERAAPSKKSQRSMA